MTDKPSRRDPWVLADLALRSAELAAANNGPLIKLAGITGSDLTATGMKLPKGLPEQQWIRLGALLGRVDRAICWWIGDWWAYGEQRYGERLAIVEADGWDGPSFRACANYGMVARKFESSCRRELLTFTHHAEVASLPRETADQLLDWCEEAIAETGKPRSTGELRQKVREVSPAAIKTWRGR
jgi:hypothetical protein